ncbi:MAG: hypothetical protein ACFFER_02650 [Candidatus Thorarchaeota archaeon]
MKEDEPLARFIRLRRYDELDVTVDKLLRENGWSAVLNQLEEIPTPNVFIPYKKYWHPPRNIDCEKSSPLYITERYLSYRNELFARDDVGWGVRDGTLRDGLVHILSLHDVVGIDLHTLRPFSSIEVSDLAALREAAIPISVEILKKQAAENRTFFLDADRIASTVFAGAVGNIIDARAREIADLEKDSHPNVIAGTYYGFKIMMEESIDTTGPIGISRQSAKAIENLAKTLDSNVSVLRSRISFKKIPWSHYDKSTQDLLQGLLLVSLGSRRKRIPEGLEILGRLGDSRALPTLHRLVGVMPKRSDMMELLLRAIADIGHHSSFDVVFPLTKKRTKGALNALAALALVRRAESLDLLVEAIEKGYRERKREAIAAIWMTGDCKAATPLWHVVTEGRTKDAEAAFISLCFLGKSGWEIIKENPSRAVREIKNAYMPDNLLNVAKGVPGFLDQPQVVEEIARELQTDVKMFEALLKPPPVCIHDEYITAIAKARYLFEYLVKISDIPEIFNNGTIQNAIQKRAPAELIWPTHRYGEWIDLVLEIQGLTDHKSVQRSIGRAMLRKRVETENLIQMLKIKAPEVLYSEGVAIEVFEALSRSEINWALDTLIDIPYFLDDLRFIEAICKAVRKNPKITHLLLKVIQVDKILYDPRFLEAIRSRLNHVLYYREFEQWLYNEHRLNGNSKLRALVDMLKSE